MKNNNVNEVSSLESLPEQVENLRKAVEAVKTDSKIKELDKRIKEVSNYCLSSEILIPLIEARDFREEQILGFYNLNRRYEGLTEQRGTDIDVATN